ncbi:unnamed protein product, partial [Polarella glacialis]
MSGRRQLGALQRRGASFAAISWATSSGLGTCGPWRHVSAADLSSSGIETQLADFMDVSRVEGFGTSSSSSDSGLAGPLFTGSDSECGDLRSLSKAIHERAALAAAALEARAAAQAEHDPKGWDGLWASSVLH